MTEKQLRWFYLILLSLIWGSSFILMKKALIGLSPVQVGALRILIAGIVLVSISYKNLGTITKRQWPYLLISSFSGTFFPAFLFVYAIRHIDSSIASLLNSLTPLNTFVLGVLLFGAPFINKQFFGILLGLLGAGFLIVKGAQINPDQNYYYALLILLATVGYGLNINIVKRYLQELKPITITLSNFVISFIPASIILWASDFSLLESDAVAKQSLFYVLLLAVVCTAFANVIFYKLVSISSPVFTSSVTYLIPLVAVIFGILDGEKISVFQLIAASIIFLGIYLSNKGR
jgi:drug/metabolite transporter (DMT)-like permease